MIKKIPDQFWFPFWVDKWIFGSMRIEFNPVERAIWVDLLALAAKDNGFIRANEETPYLPEQLAGMLVYNVDDFKNAIESFIEKDKLKRDKNGVLYITNWDKYKFTEGHKRVIKHRARKQSETENVTSVTENVTHNKSNHNKSNHNKSNHILDDEFEEFWKFYKSIGNEKDDIGNKQEAKKAYAMVRKKHEKKEIANAVHGYDDYLKIKKEEDNFSQRKKFASTWLRSDRWKEYSGVKYKAKL